MNHTRQLAKHLREVYFGGNWTAVNFKDQLLDVNWELASQKMADLNSIAVLTNHLHFYVLALKKYFADGVLNGKDADSFLPLTIYDQHGWEIFLESFFSEAKTLSETIEQLEDEKLEDVFYHEKYGMVYRNLLGLIEHAHYHLGQITLLKKLARK